MDRFATEIEQFLDYLAVERGLASNTLSNYRRDLTRCAATLRIRSRRSFAEADYDDISHHLGALRKDGLKPKTISRHLYALRSFFRFLDAEGLLTENPTIKIEPMKTWANLPEVLSIREVERLLSVNQGDDPYSLRRRAVVELLYATGLRVSEVADLRLQDVHADVGYIECIGKGNKQRLVPIGEWALRPIDRWLESGRPQLVNGSESEWLFVNRGGGRVSRQQLWNDIRTSARAAGIKRHVSPHTLRHSFATHLLQRGMNLRALQEMLGHADITTTQFYTKIEPEHLKQAHRKFHPRG